MDLINKSGFGNVGWTVVDGCVLFSDECVCVCVCAGDLIRRVRGAVCVNQLVYLSLMHGSQVPGFRNDG